MLLETLKNSAFVLDKQGVFGEPPEALKKYGSTMSDLLKSGHVNFEITLPQVTMSGLSALPEISNLISRMNWCLLTAEDTDYFLLSDNPCSVAHAEPPTQSGLGLGLPTAEMAFPIGKSHCLVTAWKDIPAKKDATRKVVNNINIKSAIFGDRFFAFPVKSKKISTLIHTYRSLNSSVEFQTFPWNAGYLQIGQKKASGEKHYLLASALKPIFV